MLSRYSKIHLDKVDLDIDWRIAYVTAANTPGMSVDLRPGRECTKAREAIEDDEQVFISGGHALANS